MSNYKMLIQWIVRLSSASLLLMAGSSAVPPSLCSAGLWTAETRQCAIATCLANHADGYDDQALQQCLGRIPFDGDWVR